MNANPNAAQDEVVIDVTTLDMAGRILKTLYEETSSMGNICYTPEQIFKAIDKPQKYTIEIITTICDYLYSKGHCITEFTNKGEFIGWSFTDEKPKPESAGH